MSNNNNTWGRGSQEFEKWGKGSPEYTKWLPDNATYNTGINPNTGQSAEDVGNSLLDLGNNNNQNNVNSCVPQGNIGSNPDSLPKSSTISKVHKLVFKSVTEPEKRFVGKCKKSGEDFAVLKVYGTLTLWENDTILIEVPAISGSGGMGYLPNSEYLPGKYMKYYVGKLLAPTNFDDGIYKTFDPITRKVTYDKEHSWKLHIYENFTNRSSFRIHPTRLSDKYDSNREINEPSDNDGCISPYGQDSVDFYNVIKDIFKNPNYVVPLTVDLLNNNNITRYIYNSYTSKYDEKYIINNT